MSKEENFPTSCKNLISDFLKSKSNFYLSETSICIGNEYFEVFECGNDLHKLKTNKIDYVKSFEHLQKLKNNGKVIETEFFSSYEEKKKVDLFNFNIQNESNKINKIIFKLEK